MKHHDFWLAMAGFLAGSVNAAAGGGTLLSFPSLLALGLSPLAANATSTVGLLPGSVASIFAPGKPSGTWLALAVSLLVSIYAGYFGAGAGILFLGAMGRPTLASRTAAGSGSRQRAHIASGAGPIPAAALSAAWAGDRTGSCRRHIGISESGAVAASAKNTAVMPAPRFASSTCAVSATPMLPPSWRNR
jgi:hypothetical protein